ncbi:hypothetical protein AAG906_028095 [Vitis piasezkii]
MTLLKSVNVLWISRLPNLVRVGLVRSKLVNDPMQQLCFGATGFQKLKRLHLNDLIGLKRVKIEDGTLPLLEELMIGPCPQLEEMPPGIRHLSKLTTLILADLQEELKLSVIPGQGRDFEIVKHIPYIHFLES